MDCEQAQGLLSEYVDDMVSPDLRDELEAHLRTCDACVRELAAMRAYVGAMHALPRVNAPPGFVEALKSRLDERPTWRKAMAEALSPFFRGAPLRVAALVTSVLVVVLVYRQMPEHRQMNEIPTPLSSTVSEKPSGGGITSLSEPPPATPPPLPAPAIQSPVSGPAPAPAEQSKPQHRPRESVTASSSHPIELVIVLAEVKREPVQSTAVPSPAPAGSTSSDKSRREVAASKQSHSAVEALIPKPAPPFEEHRDTAPPAPQAAPAEARGRRAAPGRASLESDSSLLGGSQQSAARPLLGDKSPIETTDELSDLEATAPDRTAARKATRQPTGTDYAIASIRKLLPRLSGSILTIERSGAPPASTSVTLRIPARNYSRFIKEIHALGTIQGGPSDKAPPADQDPLTVRITLRAP